MKRLIPVLFVVLAFCVGCSNSELLTPREFTEEMADVSRRGSPDWKIEIVEDLELKLILPGNKDGGTQFLHNAYDEYKHDPNRKSEIMHRYAQAWRNSVATMGEPVDPARIVPVIKDKPWLAELRQSIIERGQTNMADLIQEPLNEELTVLYVQDSPKHLRYLTVKDLATTKVKTNELRSLACTNLQRVLPEIKIEGGNGFYMITAGGNYEASLLLIDSVWKDARIKIGGDIVVGIPSRDLILVADGGKPALIDKLKDIVAKAHPAAPHRLTPKLFIRQEGKWVEFTE